jgi:hypothetical protein
MASLKALVALAGSRVGVELGAEALVDVGRKFAVWRNQESLRRSSVKAVRVEILPNATGFFVLVAQAVEDAIEHSALSIGGAVGVLASNKTCDDPLQLGIVHVFPLLLTDRK